MVAYRESMSLAMGTMAVQWGFVAAGQWAVRGWRLGIVMVWPFSALKRFARSSIVGDEGALEDSSSSSSPSTVISVTVI